MGRDPWGASDDFLQPIIQLAKTEGRDEVEQIDAQPKALQQAWLPEAENKKQKRIRRS